MGAKNVRMLQKHLDHLHGAYDHPNRRLHYDHYLTALFCAFYNPLIRSTRMIEDFSKLPELQEQLGIERICRNTFSQASRLFDPALLIPLIRDLRQRLPELRRRDVDLEQIVQKVVAADGSYFSMLSEVAWALHHHRRDGQVQGQIRLEFQLDVLRGLPEKLSVSGQEQGSETAAQAGMLDSGVIYVGDRNYVDFDYFQAVVAAGSDLVVRARTNAPNFVSQEELPRSEKDLEHGVLSDRQGSLSGRGAPSQAVRELVIADPETGKVIRLITTLLDLPGHVIGLLYRKRWQIELFFRWLKCWANVEHLMSTNRNGVRLQFYVAVVGVLQMYVRTGRPLSKYAYAMLGHVAHGQATLEQIVPILEHRERERELERARRARKKAAKTNA